MAARLPSRAASTSRTPPASRLASGLPTSTGLNTTLEVDLYANYGFSLSKDFSATVGYLAYVYEGNSSLNTGEINVSVSAYGLTAKISHAVTDYFGIAGSGTQYYELNYAYEVAAVKGLSLALHYGVTDGKNAADERRRLRDRPFLPGRGLHWHRVLLER